MQKGKPVSFPVFTVGELIGLHSYLDEDSAGEYAAKFGLVPSRCFFFMCLFLSLLPFDASYCPAVCPRCRFLQSLFSLCSGRFCSRSNLYFHDPEFFSPHGLADSVLTTLQIKEDATTVPRRQRNFGFPSYLQTESSHLGSDLPHLRFPPSNSTERDDNPQTYQVETRLASCLADSRIPRLSKKISYQEGGVGRMVPGIPLHLTVHIKSPIRYIRY